ncbi:MAG TPA: methyltransferase domain-containing protein [Anaerolineaceae bacterium]|nr:methyltransferase domain-containing protein [Anaerolineaceae bacterium]
MQNRFTDRGYLQGEQYKGEENLRARIRLHEQFSINPYGMQRWIFDQLDLPSGRRDLLELGCGPGDLWALNRQRMPAEWRVTLTDLSFGMARRACERLDDANNWHFLETDAQAIPFDAERFDAVIANHMLYHVPDRAKALAEIWRVLKPGGRFFATTNGPDHLKEVDLLIRRYQPEQAPGSLHTGLGGGKNFDLENGVAQAQAWFKEVGVKRYEDALVVTEVEPLVAYVQSMIMHGLEDASLAGLRAEIANKIETEGAVRIQKDVGIIQGIKA